jgi:hypothetical protein
MRFKMKEKSIRVRINSKKEMLEVLKFLERRTPVTWPGNELPTNFDYQGSVQALVVSRKGKDFIIHWDFEDENEKSLSIPEFKREILSAVVSKECSTFKGIEF